MKKKAIVVCMLAALSGPSQLVVAQAAEPSEQGAFEIRRRSLPNGLRVVLIPDRTIPTVAVAIYYDVGSRNEVRGRSGFAHLFEHLMFQGSANVQKAEHFALIMNRGGSVNGTTSIDRTNYYETLPSNELALGLWLEADRMQSLAVTRENFENQRDVVMNERRQRYDDVPYRPSMLRVNEMAYGDYWPYAHSTIGDMTHLEQAPLSAVQEFYAQYYTPSNAVLSVAGDFDADQAMQLIERYFGDIESHPPPAYDPPELRPQTSERAESMLDTNAQLPAFHVTYHIPPMRHADHYPLEVLGLVLGDGQSSRLYQELVKRREMCQGIWVSTDDRRGPDLFSFWAILAQGHTGEQAREVIYNSLSDIAQRGITARELEKAKNRIRAIFTFGLQSNLLRAKQAAEFELYWGNAELLHDELGHYLRVTADDVRRVANEYFATTNRTVLDVLPATNAAEGEDQ